MALFGFSAGLSFEFHIRNSIKNVEILFLVTLPFHIFGEELLEK